MVPARRPQRIEVHVRALLAIVVVALSGVPQLALAVEDERSRVDTEEFRSIRSTLFGDRAAGAKAPSVPAPTASAAGREGVHTATRSGVAASAFVRRSVAPGQPARLGPPRALTRLFVTLHLSASSFV